MTSYTGKPMGNLGESFKIIEKHLQNLTTTAIITASGLESSGNELESLRSAHGRVGVVYGAKTIEIENLAALFFWSKYQLWVVL